MKLCTYLQRLAGSTAIAAALAATAGLAAAQDHSQHKASEAALTKTWVGPRDLLALSRL